MLLVQYETPRKGQTLPVSLNILARAVALGLGAWVLEPNHLGLNPVLPLASSVTLDRRLHLPVPQLLPLCNGTITAPTMKLFR